MCVRLLRKLSGLIFRILIVKIDVEYFIVFCSSVVVCSSLNPCYRRSMSTVIASSSKVRLGLIEYGMCVEKCYVKSLVMPFLNWPAQSGV